MSLNGVIASLGAFTLQVTRTASGPRSNGRYNPGAQSTFTITGGVEPINGRELQDLPVGRRGDEILTVYTDAALIAEKPGVDPDVVRYLGADPDAIELLGFDEPWTVIAVPTWTGLGSAHREARIARAPSPQGVVP